MADDIKLIDKVFSNKVLQDAMGDLSDEEVKTVRGDIEAMVEELESSIFTLTSKIRTEKDASDLIKALNEILSPGSEALWQEKS